jgi:Mg2+ and Co2+ transporter CorA
MTGLEFIKSIFWAAGIVVFAIVGLAAWFLRERTR